MSTQERIKEYLRLSEAASACAKQLEERYLPRCIGPHERHQAREAINHQLRISVACLTMAKELEGKP